MICGALQTLNEEACEDVLEETEETIPEFDNDVPITFIVPPSPEAQQGESIINKIRSNESNNIAVNNTKDINSTKYYNEPTVAIVHNSTVSVTDKAETVTVKIDCLDNDDESHF